MTFSLVKCINKDACRSFDFLFIIPALLVILHEKIRKDFNWSSEESSIFELFICVCYCVYLCTCVCAHVRACLCVDARGWHWMSNSIVLQLTFETGSFAEPRDLLIVWTGWLVNPSSQFLMLVWQILWAESSLYSCFLSLILLSLFLSSQVWG